MPTHHMIQKRSLSQVFLQVDWPLHKIADQITAWQATRILEIGPGAGVLTQVLCASGWQVTAVEKDVRFAGALPGALSKYQDKLEVLNEDILGFDLVPWLSRAAGRAAVVGNIPYNISSPIITWLLPHLPQLCGACLMVQWEYAQRLAGAAGSKAYGSLSVYTQLHSDVSIAFKIENTCFRPIPKVDSAIVLLTPKKEALCATHQLPQVEQLTQLAFQQRRKKLRNSIERLLHDKDPRQCPIDLDRRPDNLSPQEYLELAKYIFAW